jgi:hypothetical protein
MFGPIGLLLVLAAFAGGCGAEPTLHEGEGDEAVQGAQLIGIGGNGEEMPSAGVSTEQPVQNKHLATPAKSSCPGCGPVPDPWKSVRGPVPDPWQTKNPAPTSGETGGDGNGNRKP